MEQAQPDSVSQLHHPEGRPTTTTTVGCRPVTPSILQRGVISSVTGASRSIPLSISGDPEQEYFADGMVEEIITALTPGFLRLSMVQNCRI